MSKQTPEQLHNLLASCDYTSCANRAIVADALKEAGRLEEAALLDHAGLEVEWHEEYNMAVNHLRFSRSNCCPICGFRLMSQFGPFCSHMLTTGYMDRPTPTLDEYMSEGHIEVAHFVYELRHLGSPVNPRCPDEDGITHAVQILMPTVGSDVIVVSCAPRPRFYLERLRRFLDERKAAGVPFKVRVPTVMEAEVE
jgi:hypothetical protein